MLLELQFDPKLIAQLFDIQPDAVVWYGPIFKEGTDEVIDFEFRYCNAAASKIFAVPARDVLGTRLKQSRFLDDVTQNHIFRQCYTVWSDGKPVEFTYYSPIFDRYFNVQ